MNKNIKKAVVGLVAFNVVASTMITAMPAQSKAAEASPIINTTQDSQLKSKASGPIKFSTLAETSGTAVLGDNGVYTLTDNKFFSIGGAMTKEKVNLLEDFNLTSGLTFGSGDADGISFIMQNNDSPNTFGSNGDGMALNGLKNAIGIALRAQTYYKPSQQNVSFYADGEFIDKKDTVKPLTYSTRVINIDWKAATRTLKYDLGDGISSSYQVADLTETFGGTEAYIGFAGVTGQGTNIHVVRNASIAFNMGEKTRNQCGRSKLTDRATIFTIGRCYSNRQRRWRFNKCYNCNFKYGRYKQARRILFVKDPENNLKVTFTKITGYKLIDRTIDILGCD
ncbi:hypothetical protein [Listeria booriae]|uniref:hypothetical protein n=1 Tax=Listeria booriae TaxID=1552123 RepID=UPI00406AB0E1